MNTTDVDKLIEQVERLDREATPGPWIVAKYAIYSTGVNPPESVVPAPQDVPTPDDCELIALYRTAAPLLAAEVQELRSALADGVRAVGVVAADAQRQIEALQTEIRELRLTLAAEQGRPEGAPSPRWLWRHARWEAIEDDRVIAFTGPYTGQLYIREEDADGVLWPVTEHGSNRAAMLAFDVTRPA